ncbi:hypothetical protein Bbelb_250820 [Branchiostoma belcheri]|nr:hypothetical protein Bbelb_250820 [Branchiostoma belcheri]
MPKATQKTRHADRSPTTESESLSGTSSFSVSHPKNKSTESVEMKQERLPRPTNFHNCSLHDGRDMDPQAGSSSTLPTISGVLNLNEQPIAPANHSQTLRLTNQSPVTDLNQIHSNYRTVTLTGTITRGKKRGQMVDIQLDLTDKEIAELSTISEEKEEEENTPKDDCIWGINKGIHIFIWSALCFPVVFVIAFFVAFYYGTITWYNIFLHYNEERTFLHKVSICPLLILFYPILIVVVSLGLGGYSAFVQLSWYCDSWREDVGDFEKGFFGWMCSKLRLDSCSPYDVVELTTPEAETLAQQDPASPPPHSESTV